MIITEHLKVRFKLLISFLTWLKVSLSKLVKCDQGHPVCLSTRAPSYNLEHFSIDKIKALQAIGRLPHVIVLESPRSTILITCIKFYQYTFVTRRDNIHMDYYSVLKDVHRMQSCQWSIKMYPCIRASHDHFLKCPEWANVSKIYQLTIIYALLEVLHL